MLYQSFCIRTDFLINLHMTAQSKSFRRKLDELGSFKALMKGWLSFHSRHGLRFWVLVTV